MVFQEMAEAGSRSRAKARCIGKKGNGNPLLKQGARMSRLKPAKPDGGVFFAENQEWLNQKGGDSFYVKHEWFNQFGLEVGD